MAVISPNMRRHSSKTIRDLPRGPCQAPEVALSPSRRRLARALVWPVAAIGWTLFLTAVVRHIRFGSSDNAVALLAGREMVRGNPFLRGWELPIDSWWLLDLLLLGLASLVWGLRLILIHAIPAALTVGLMLAGIWVAGLDRPGQRRWVAAGALLLILGLPHVELVLVLLQGPQHQSATLCCLVAIGLLARARLGDGRFVGAAALLAVAVNGDPVALVMGVAPVAGAGVIDALRRRRLPALAMPLMAGAIAVAGAISLRALVWVAGGFSNYRGVAYYGAWRANLKAVPSVLGGILGVGRLGGLNGAAALAHILVAGLIGLAVTFTAIRLLVDLLGSRPEPSQEDGRGIGPRPGSGWIDGALLLGCVGGVATFAVLTAPGPARLSARYLIPTLVYGAVLTARRAREVAMARPAWPVAVVGVALAAVYFTSPLAWVRRPATSNPAEPVVTWLRANHLDRGYGPYWVAGITTVTAGGDVAVRPVEPAGSGLRPMTLLGSRDWFEDRRPFRFVILQPPGFNGGDSGVTEPLVTAAFGPPARRVTIYPYEVLVWDRDLRSVLLVGNR
jgi:hypothetical protein